MESFLSKQRGMAAVWAVLITAIIISGLAGGGYYYLSQKNSKEKKDLESQINALKKEIEDVKKAASSASSESSSALSTYNNRWYGYSFQYPKTFSLIDYLYDGATGEKVEYGKIVVVDKKAIAENALKTESDMTTPYFMISVVVEHQFTLSELSLGLEESGGELSDTTVDGETAWKIVYTEPSIMDESYSTGIYFNHSGYGYSISWKNSAAAGTHDKEIDAMVTSFKFN